MKLYFGVPVCLLFVALTVCAQTTEELSVVPSKVDEAPAVAPAECPASVVVVAEQTSGSESYVRLKRLLNAMEFGHDGSAQLLSALRAPSSSNSVGAAWLHINMQLSSALNNYLCASFLTGKIKTGSSDELAIHTFISVFNRMALETIQLRAQMKAAAQEADNGQQGMSVSLADGVSKTLQERKEVGTDLQNAILLTALMTVDTSDKTATKTDTLSMTAKERTDLLKQVTTLASVTPVDEFSRGAKLLQEFLTNHKPGAGLGEEGKRPSTNR
jgi:hypothetical protein